MNGGPGPTMLLNGMDDGHDESVSPLGFFCLFVGATRTCTFADYLGEVASTNTEIDNPQRQFSSNAEHVTELMTISQKLHGSQACWKFKDMLQVHFVLAGCLLLVRFLILFGHPVGSWNFAHCEAG